MGGCLGVCLEVVLGVSGRLSGGCLRGVSWGCLGECHFCHMNIFNHMLIPWFIIWSSHSFTSSLKNIPHGIQLRIGGSIKVIYRMENVIDSSYFNSETNLKIPQNHVHQKYQTSKGLLEGTFPWVCMVRYKSFCKEFWCVFWLMFYQFQENSKGWVNFTKGNYVVQFLFRFQVEVLEAEEQKRGELFRNAKREGSPKLLVSYIFGPEYWPDVI